MSDARGARIAGLSLGGLWLAAFLLAAVAMSLDDREATVAVAHTGLETAARMQVAAD